MTSKVGSGYRIGIISQVISEVPNPDLRGSSKGMSLVASPVEAQVGGHEFRLGKDLLGWLQLLTELRAFWDLERKRTLKLNLQTRVNKEKKLLRKKKMAVAVHGIHSKAFS
jgi:hypothetical protein